MSDELIQFETAKLAREGGFNGWTLSAFESDGSIAVGGIGGSKKWNTYSQDTFARPTQSVFQRWLRELYNIHISITPSFDKEGHIPSGYSGYLYWIFEDNNVKSREIPHGYCTDVDIEKIPLTFEDAMELTLLEALKIVIEKNNDK